MPTNRNLVHRVPSDNTHNHGRTLSPNGNLSSPAVAEGTWRLASPPKAVIMAKARFGIGAEAPIAWHLEQTRPSRSRGGVSRATEGRLEPS